MATKRFIFYNKTSLSCHDFMFVISSCSHPKKDFGGIARPLGPKAKARSTPKPSLDEHTHFYLFTRPNSHQAQFVFLVTTLSY
jgi:hypothetical protein